MRELHQGGLPMREGENTAFPLTRYAFCLAYRESGTMPQVLLRAGVKRKIAHSWCVVSGCVVREMFAGKPYADAAREEVCQRLCHWKNWRRTIPL